MLSALRINSNFLLQNKYLFVEEIYCFGSECVKTKNSEAKIVLFLLLRINSKSFIIINFRVCNCVISTLAKFLLPVHSHSSIKRIQSNTRLNEPFKRSENLQSILYMVKETRVFEFI